LVDARETKSRSGCLDPHRHQTKERAIRMKAKQDDNLTIRVSGDNYATRQLSFSNPRRPKGVTLV
jgi:hypothetical protein